MKHRAADGITKAQLSRVYAPVGLDLGGPTPPESALAILAEIVAVRRKWSHLAQQECIMLIEKYDLQILTPPCEPGAERFTAKAWLVTDIREALPYLNAALRGAAYFPDSGAEHSAPALTWKKAGHNVAFHPYEIAVSNAVDRQSAQQELDGLVALVNRTWERRAEITPSFEARRRPTMMDVYKLLPQTNCKQCGQPTCYTFALKLTASQKRIEDCPPLFEPQRADNLAALQEIVIDVPAME